MDLTGSIADATAPLSLQLFGSTEGVGSSFIDTMLLIAISTPSFLLNWVAGVGADLGSTTGA